MSVVDFNKSRAAPTHASKHSEGVKPIIIGGSDPDRKSGFFDNDFNGPCLKEKGDIESGGSGNYSDLCVLVSGNGLGFGKKTKSFS